MSEELIQYILLNPGKFCDSARWTRVSLFMAYGATLAVIIAVWLKDWTPWCLRSTAGCMSRWWQLKHDRHLSQHLTTTSIMSRCVTNTAVCDNTASCGLGARLSGVCAIEPQQT